MYINLNKYQIKTYKKQTKKELLEQLDWMQGRLHKANLNDSIGGCYVIEVYKNKIPVQALKFDWDINPDGAKFSDVRELSILLMKAYQDYNSLVETKIVLLDDWDELTTEQRNLLNVTT